jgi:hypothetical protein
MKINPRYLAIAYAYGIIILPGIIYLFTKNTLSLFISVGYNWALSVIFIILALAKYGTVFLISGLQWLGINARQEIKKLAILGFVFLVIGFLLQLIEAFSHPA